MLAGSAPVAVADVYNAIEGQTLETIPGSYTTIVPQGSSWEWFVPDFDPATVDDDYNTTWMLPTDQFNAVYDGPFFEPAAPGPLGYGDAWIVTAAPVPASGFRGAGYFRLDFTTTEDMNALLIDVMRDDGAIVYLDGVEIGRSNMAAGPDTWSLGDGGNTGTENAYHPLTHNAGFLPAGNHTLAVSVHQTNNTSSDMSFDLRMRGAPGLLGVLGNDTDADGEPLTAIRVSGPSNGVLNLNPDGSFTYTPNVGFRGPTDSFTYRASDGSLSSGVVTVTINVRPANLSATPTEDRYAVVEDTSITVGATSGTTLVPAGSVWSYLDDGSDLGTSWTDQFYDDSFWASGPAQLGYGDGDETTLVSYGPDPNFKYVTTYFRHTFQVTDPSLYSSLSLLMKRDDGVAVYLNGVEILRDNLIADATAFDFATAASNDDGLTFISFNGLDASALQAGTNVLAVEMHQTGFNSSDMSFDLELIGAEATVGLLPNDTDPEGNPLTVALATGPANGTLNLNPDGTFDYTPNPDFSGVDSFTYRVNDGTSDSNPATVFIAVLPINDIPVAVDDVYFVETDGVLDIAPDANVDLVLAGSVWNFLDNGSDQGVAWREPAFDDSGWNSGAAKLGYGDGDEATIVNFGGNAANKFVTTYFRHAFEVEDASRVQTLTLMLKRDDGAAVYLNGTEVARDNLAPDAAFNTLAPVAAPDDGDGFLTFNVDPSLLVDGTNVLAVEVHQTQLNSSDLSFDLSLAAFVQGDGVQRNDYDPDSFPVTAILGNPPTNGSIFFNDDGSFTYTPDPGFMGSDTFTYFLDDGLEPSNLATVTVHVGVAPPSLEVVNTNDSGAGSLRQAMLNANLTPGTDDTITFNIPGAGPHTIQLTSALPDLTDPVTMQIPGGSVVQVGLANAFTLGQYPSLTKTGAGTLTIGGTQNISAGTTAVVSEGTLNLNSDATNLVVNNNATVNLNSSQHLGGLAIGNGAVVTIGAGGDKVLSTGSLNITGTGKLDVTDNDLIVRASAATRETVAAAVAGYVASGANGLAWDGSGITSSIAAVDVTFLTAVGVMLNDDGLGNPFHFEFSGESVDANATLVKFTYYGDSDLTGGVDGTDYALIDNGFNAGLTGWFNGDYSYDNIVDGTDYALIDNAFNAQGAPLSLEPVGHSLAFASNASASSDTSSTSRSSDSGASSDLDAAAVSAVFAEADIDLPSFDSFADDEDGDGDIDWEEDLLDLLV